VSSLAPMMTCPAITGSKYNRSIHFCSISIMTGSKRSRGRPVAGFFGTGLASRHHRTLRPREGPRKTRPSGCAFTFSTAIQSQPGYYSAAGSSHEIRFGFSGNVSTIAAVDAKLIRIWT
jgi:hypothetical protein